MPRYNSYTIKYKLQVVEWHNNHGRNVSQTAREFSVDRKRVRDWLDTEDVLRMHRRGPDAKKKRIGL